MPFTPYHLGPAFFLGLLFLSFIDFPTFIIANVILDIEPFLILTLNLDYPLHGFFHSLVGGTVVAIPLRARYLTEQIMIGGLNGINARADS